MPEIFLTVFDSVHLLNKARQLIFEYIKARRLDFELHQVCVLWFSRTPDTWKVLMNTDLPDNMYYEVTYNSYKKETCILTYNRLDIVYIKDEDV